MSALDLNLNPSHFSASSAALYSCLSVLLIHSYILHTTFCGSLSPLSPTLTLQGAAPRLFCHLSTPSTVNTSIRLWDNRWPLWETARSSLLHYHGEDRVQAGIRSTDQISKLISAIDMCSNTFPVFVSLMLLPARSLVIMAPVIVQLSSFKHLILFLVYIIHSTVWPSNLYTLFPPLDGPTHWHVFGKVYLRMGTWSIFFSVCQHIPLARLKSALQLGEARLLRHCMVAWYGNIWQ